MSIIQVSEYGCYYINMWKPGYAKIVCPIYTKSFARLISIFWLVFFPPTKGLKKPFRYVRMQKHTAKHTQPRR